MSRKFSNFAAGIILASVCVFAVATGWAEVQMDAPFDPNPTDPVKSKVKDVLVYEYDGDNTKVPVKTLKITNNTEITVYPVMRDGNEAVLASNPNVGLYDPYDAVKTEYRGYIGYKEGNKYYFGLKSKKSILIRCPLVFWNGARMGIATDNRYLVPAAGKPNPLNYKPESIRVIASAETDNKDASLIANGVVMWYRAPKGGPALDAPDQLLEWTVRDKAYLSNANITRKTNGEIPKGEKVTLINYDVSYVDNMFLPVGMEALNVPVPAPPYPPGKNPQPFGWIGAINKPADLRDGIKEFTIDNNQLLGAYFGGKGWPRYNIPTDPIGGIKIPAGQNVFAQSPLAGALSSYDVLNNHFMLTSAGPAQIRVNIGGEGNASKGDILTLSPNEDVSKVKFLQKGYAVEGHAPEKQLNPIQPGTKILEVLHVSTGPGDPSRIKLDKPLVATQLGCNFDFFRTVTDYASDAMIKIWYSWAQFYLDSTTKTPSRSVEGAVSVDKATMTFSTQVTGLVEGMQVTGPGLDKPKPADKKNGVIILAIADDEKSITLSQLARENHPLSERKVYTFIKPQPLPSAPTRLYTFNFTNDPKEPSRVPVVFAKKVYLIMASMAQIAKNKDPKVKTPHVLELMNNVVGGNMGFIFDTDKQRFSDDGLAISAFIRDMIKSVLRGVSDFTKFSEFDNSGKQIWYPDPKVKRGGLAFNAFNLDPFVWFVHVKLKFSGYGFSLDDDTADVGAGQATKMQLTVGGVAGLPNKEEWTIQAPYGPVTGEGQWDPSKTQSFYLAITNATNARPIVITSEKHGLANGDTVTIDQVVGNTAANNTFKVANVTKNTFELAGSRGNGNYVSGGRWTIGPLPYITGTDPLEVYWKLKGDDRTAGFQGAILTGPGVKKRGSVRILQLGNDKQGQLALNIKLMKDDGTPLPKGTYTWTFSGK